MKILAAVLLMAAVAFADPCGSCGNEVPADANFCPKCGAAKAAASKKVEDAVKAAEEKKRDFIASLESLRRAYEESGQTQRANEIDLMIRGLEETDLGAAGGVAPAAGGRTERKSIKEANDLYESAKLYMSTINPAKRGTNYGIAIDKLREIVEKYPESDKLLDAWYNLGRCYSDGFVKRYEDAIKAYDKVSELDPNYSGDGRILAAQLVDKLGRYKEAYERYGAVIEHDANAKNVQWARERRAKLEPYR